jgi:hypothetical protein
MEIDSIGSDRRHTKYVVEEIKGCLILALLIHQSLAILDQGVDMFPPMPSIRMAMEKSSRHVPFLWP